MRAELEVQVKQRKDAEKSTKNTEKEQFTIDQKLIEERKAIEEQRRANFKGKYMHGSGVDMLGQVNSKAEAKKMQENLKKEKEMEERK